MARLATRVLALCALLSVPTLGACAAATDGMQEKLYDSTRAYNRSLRWSDFDRAAEFVPAASEAAFMDEHEAVDDELIVIDYELTRLNMQKQIGVASCRVKISWHTDRDIVVKDTEVEQQWQFFEGQWFLVDEFRVKGDPLAIFAERGKQGQLDHPYLPGLEQFRKDRDIGISEEEKRDRDRARRKAAKKGAHSSADAPPSLPDDEKHELPTQQHVSGL